MGWQKCGSVCPRSAPTLAEVGEEGAELWAELELKLVADVGIIGVPNAGKSTLLGVLSNARPKVRDWGRRGALAGAQFSWFSCMLGRGPPAPFFGAAAMHFSVCPSGQATDGCLWLFIWKKVADYPFTTLVPNLGVCELDYRTTVFADIPGRVLGAFSIPHAPLLGMLLHSHTAHAAVQPTPRNCPLAVHPVLPCMHASGCRTAAHISRVLTGGSCMRIRPRVLRASLFTER